MKFSSNAIGAQAVKIIGDYSYQKRQHECA